MPTIKDNMQKAIYEILGEEADKLELVLEMVVLHLVQHSLQLWNLLNANLKRKNNEAVIIVKFKTKLLMTPKLQQSINILQLSAHELGELIEKNIWKSDFRNRLKLRT